MSKHRSSKSHRYSILMVVITLTMIPRGFVSICGETIAFIAKRGESEDVCVCCEGYITGDLRGDRQDTQLFYRCRRTSLVPNWGLRYDRCRGISLRAGSGQGSCEAYRRIHHASRMRGLFLWHLRRLYLATMKMSEERDGKEARNCEAGSL